MTTRDKLIQQLVWIAHNLTPNQVSQIADFILADRKRIVEPLVEAKNYRINAGGSWLKGLRTNDGIDETLKRAGEL